MRKFLTLLVMVVFTTVAIAQNKTVKGKVTDDAGKPIANASVIAKGAKSGSITNESGEFTFSIPATSKNITISYIGYVTQTVAATNNVTVKLSLDNTALSEIIVTGYTSRQKKENTAAISTISGASIESNPNTSIDNMLQGKASGVNITRTNGRPGGNAYIRIRGEGSITASNEPLFIVDGISVPSDYYNALNPNDIEDIQILKDAASASLYGARGANGVVVVNTRKGKASTSGISYRFQYGINQKTPDNFRLMDINEKLQYEYDNGFANQYISSFLVADGYPNLAAAPKSVIQGYWAKLQSQNTDWQAVLLRNAVKMTHEIAANGGNDKGSYTFSLKKSNEDGVGIGSYFNSYSGRLNAEYKLRDWVTVSNNISVAQQNYSALRDRYNAQNPFYAIYAYNPYEPVFNNDGTYNLTNQGFPIAEAVINNPEIQDFTKITNNTSLKFNIAKGLTFKTTLGIYYIDYKRESYIKPNSVLDIYVGDPTARGSKTDNGSRDFNYTWTNILNYEKTISEKHKIGITAGTEQINDNFYSYSVSKKGFASGNLFTLDNASTVTAGSTSRSQFAFQSGFAEARYTYDGKYTVTGSFRRDGSSRFGADNRYGNFYSGSAGWNLTKEKFLQNVKWLDLLKLRGSIGTAGNAQIGNYNSLQLFSYSSYNNLTSTVPSQVANINLSWEKLRTYDIGIEYEILKGRISGSIDYYNKKTFSLLLAKPLPSTTGFTSITQNIGEMENKGVEFDIRTIPVRTKDFTWTVDFNIARNFNKITQLVNGSDIPNGVTRYVVGQPKDVFYLVRWAGVDPATGNAQYLDVNGKVTTTYSASNAVVLDGKNSFPKFTGGLNTSLAYKTFTLIGSFVFKTGSYTYNYVQRDLNSDGSNIYQAQSSDLLNYWKKAGDVTPNPSPSGVVYTTDRFLQNSSYLRLREVTVAYDLPKSVLAKLHMKSLRFYVTGQNLWTKTNYQGDPEVGIGNTESGLLVPGQASLYSYPNVRTFLGGINITF